VSVGRLELTGVDGPLVSLVVKCSKGTYVRTLARDIGEALGSCAHLASLRRTRAGGRDVAEAVALEARPGKDELSARVMPMDLMLPSLASVVLSETAASGIKDGRQPAPDGIAGPAPGLMPGEPVKVLDGTGRLLAVAEAAEGAFPLRLRVVLV